MSSSEDPNRPGDISAAELQQIVRIFADSDLRELRLSVGAVDLVVSRNEHVDAAITAPPAPAPREATPPRGLAQEPARQPVETVAEPAAEMQASSPDSATVADGLVPVRSPALGTFYRRPAPDQPAFVEVGSVVTAGDPVGTIEVMKMFTTVTAQESGTVAEICVGDAVLVEFEQVLYYLEPLAD